MPDKNEAMEAARNEYLKKHPMRVHDRNAIEKFDIRYDAFTAGHAAASESAEWVGIKTVEDLPKESRQYLFRLRDSDNCTVSYLNLDDQFYFGPSHAVETYSHYMPIPPTPKETT